MHHAVGHEVARARGDVVERSSIPSGSIETTFSRLCDLTARASMERLRVIAGSVRWWKRSCCSARPDADVPLALHSVLDDERQPELTAGEPGPVDDGRIGVADPDDAAAERALGVEDAGEEALVPIERSTPRPLDDPRIASTEARDCVRIARTSRCRSVAAAKRNGVVSMLRSCR
jgi:hypothetical protein